MGFQGKVGKTKRSLGQNFFVNRNLAKQITDIIEKENADLIVEIGPGSGSFTQFLVKQNSDLLLIEKDDVLSKILAEEYPSVKVKNTDFLEWEFDELKSYSKKRILFFGSLPYNVSKKIIQQILSSNYFNTASYFIIQKEVAEKYTDLEPNNSILSVYTSLFADVKRLFDISPESFKPRPNVNSSFVRFAPKNMDIDIDVEAFKKFLQTCFKYPRKTLRNNLKDSFKIENKKTQELLSKRPQHLSLNEFLFLFSNIN
jgi:16S rRNA (adenine1518-N6/adenine1519-N6)-dimethyltransferase